MLRRLQQPFLVLALMILPGLLQGCGYTLQTSASPLAEKEGIRRVFVAPVVNNTFKTGVENLMYNSLIRTLAAHRRVVLVTKEEDADGILKGIVTVAQYSPGAATTANQLAPLGATGADAVLQNTVVATEYSAALSCSFTLWRKDPPPGKRPLVWTASFSRGKPFPAANQLGVYGTTAPLINDSEFDRALSDLSQQMGGDVHESMLAVF